ncbi:hypothetical protein MYX75_01080 [Acidobacteria bacterium AH-259-A15]|nr:hypothetical protein [Acidobacteria bacterium AH-259-A15]
MSLELVVEIALDTGTERVAFLPFYGAAKFYSPRLISIDGTRREISLVPGDFRAADFSLELDNTDNYWSNLKNTTPFKNRVVKVRIGDSTAGEADFTVVAKGKIQSWGGADIFTISCVDETLIRFDQTISGVITKNQFPDLPDSTPLELAPLVIGTVSSDGLSNTGALPAYLIDPAVSQAKYQYVAAQETMKSIDKVYKYGVVVGSGFTVQQRTFGTDTFTTIEFDADQRDTERPNELEITWDGKGLTDDGTPSGDNITNPAKAWKEVLLKNGWTAAELDTSEFDQAALILDVRGVTCGFAAIDKDETIRDISVKFAESFNMTTFVTLGGKIAVTVPEPGVTAAANLVTIDEGNIARGSFVMEGPEEMASTLDYEFSRNWQADEFDERGDLTDSAQTTKIGEDVRETAELWYVRNPSSASAVANDKLFFLREERVSLGLLLDPDLIKQIEIGDDVRVTHFAGLGLGGFSSQLFRVLAAGFEFDDQNILGSVRLVDLTEASFAFSKDWLKYVPGQPGVWTDHIFFPSKNQPGPSLVIS